VPQQIETNFFAQSGEQTRIFGYFHEFYHLTLPLSCIGPT